MVPVSHYKGGVADWYQPFSVSLATTNPVLIHATQHHQFLPFAEAELRPISSVVAERSNRPEEEGQQLLAIITAATSTSVCRGRRCG